MPLPDQDRTRGKEPGREGEEGYTEDATWEGLSEAVRDRRLPRASGEKSGPPEQNAEAVMPTVWAMRMAAGWGAIATRCCNKLVDAEFYVGMGRLTGFMGVELHVLKVPTLRLPACTACLVVS